MEWIAEVAEGSWFDSWAVKMQEEVEVQKSVMMKDGAKLVWVNVKTVGIWKRNGEQDILS